MTVDNFIAAQLRELQENGHTSPEYSDLYSNIKHSALKTVLASLHSRFIGLFKLMNDRLPTREHTAHFWADPSRNLISAIDMTTSLQRALKSSEHSFEVDEYYSKLFDKCMTFLRSGGGSIIPENTEKVDLYYTLPIFTPSSSQKILRKDHAFHASLKHIGGGSYANIYKFHDDFFQHNFALKRAKPDLTAKERERFKREFTEMKNLCSPYILEVYSFDESRFQYVMEYMDYSLETYIQKFNSEIKVEVRKSVVLQVLKAFAYLHSKNLVHRDISPKNVLLKKYDDVLVVKISDFGLVKTPDSTLTSASTEMKGYFNDPALVTEGFDSYKVIHETYALTKLIFYIMTGKTNTVKIPNAHMNAFVTTGLHPQTNKRYQNIDEITEAFRELCRKMGF
ncbi:protein kinase family protein [Bdellovibrio sp. HCB2-146]|uniref:protein kinase family protein n=1 Tax=Bdellovibrio sp. HCB2-146 TaxID=3394362 RepID=UPI0039BC5AA8